LPRPDKLLARATWSALASCLLLTSPQAIAQTIVTACGRDDAAGGTNLATALALGGAIVIRCASAAQTVEMTKTYAVANDTSIDGEGRVALTGQGARPFFTNAHTLTLANLTVRNPALSGAPVALSTFIVVGGRVVLARVRTENTPAPYAVTDFTATDSVFENNGDPAGHSYRAVIDAESVVIRQSTFDKNFDHPIGGGASPTGTRSAASRTIVIEDSTFSGNRFPLLAHDASLVIRRSKFVDNGTRTPEADRAWGCCAGALTIVHSIAEIADSEFSGNGSSGFGGAVSALASRVTITRTLFENNVARIGGAVMFWGGEARTNIWSTGRIQDPLTLTLARVRFRGNSASEIGGALAWSGEVLGDAALFAANRARRGAAVAHWSAADPLDPEFADVFTALVDLTQPRNELLALGRGAFLDNVAGQQGAALDGGDAVVRLGNALVARNSVEAAGSSGALVGNEITLVNSTVIDNRSAGITMPAAARKLSLANTIVARNERGNCVAGIAVDAAAANMQFPGSSCGSSVTSTDPSLDDEYAPSLLSPARFAGQVSACLGALLVGGKDFYGRPRGNNGKCALGAIEPDITRDLFADTPLDGAPGGAWRWARWILFLFIVIGLILGFICMRRRRAAACT
jgi:hypothetical protein